MRHFYLTTLVILSLSVFLCTSCSDDGDDGPSCDPPTDLASNLIGVWNVGGTTVEFKADGTLVDADDYLIEVSLQGVDLDYKSYTVLSETMINIKAANIDDTLSSDEDVEVTKNDCDEVNLVFQGFITDVLTR